MTKYPKKDTRILTPSRRYAVVVSYDADDRVHVRYFDEEGGEGCFPAKLIRDCDILTAPAPEMRHYNAEQPVASEIEERQLFWARSRAHLLR